MGCPSAFPINPTHEQSTINVSNGSSGSISTSAAAVGIHCHGFALFSVCTTLYSRLSSILLIIFWQSDESDVFLRRSNIVSSYWQNVSMSLMDFSSGKWLALRASETM